MALGSNLKNFNVFLNGTSFAGKVEECTLPKLKLKTEEFRGGGMEAPVDISQGFEKFTTDFTLKDCSPIILGTFSPREGARQSFIFRGAYEDWNGSVAPREIIMRGKITEIDPGTAKAGESGQLKASMTLEYYSDTLNGQLINEVDVINMTYISGGSDLLTDIRNAIGL